MVPDHPDQEHTWKARNLRPVILTYVTVVFVAFIALAQLVFHSPEAVKALAMAWVLALRAWCRRQ